VLGGKDETLRHHSRPQDLADLLDPGTQPIISIECKYHEYHDVGPAAES